MFNTRKIIRNVCISVWHTVCTLSAFSCMYWIGWRFNSSAFGYRLLVLNDCIFCSISFMYWMVASSSAFSYMYCTVSSSSAFSYVHCTVNLLQHSVKCTVLFHFLQHSVTCTVLFIFFSIQLHVLYCSSSSAFSYMYCTVHLLQHSVTCTVLFHLL